MLQIVISLEFLMLFCSLQIHLHLCLIIITRHWHFQPLECTQQPPKPPNHILTMWSSMSLFPRAILGQVLEYIHFSNLQRRKQGTHTGSITILSIQKFYLVGSIIVYQSTLREHKHTFLASANNNYKTGSKAILSIQNFSGFYRLQQRDLTFLSSYILIYWP